MSAFRVPKGQQKIAQDVNPGLGKTNKASPARACPELVEGDDIGPSVEDFRVSSLRDFLVGPVEPRTCFLGYFLSSPSAAAYTDLLTRKLFRAVSDRAYKILVRRIPLYRTTLNPAGNEHDVEARFTPSLIRAVANTAMNRADVLPFWFGESDQPTPAFIREAAIASLHDGETFYSENLGRSYLRQALSIYLTDLHQRAIPIDRVAVTASGVSALMVASQLLVRPGDRVVTVTPLWPNAVEIPKVIGGQVTCISLQVQHGRWTLPLEKLLEALVPETRMLILNSPNNPTGWTIQPQEQRALLAHCRRHGIWILADDVYERLVYADGVQSAPSFLSFAEEDDRLIVVNSFSKAWSMTGWRVGWMVAPTSVFPDLAALLEFNVSCVSEFTQRAATIALQQGEPYVVALRAELGETKQKLLAALRQLPTVEVPQADGAMYLFLRIAGQEDSLHLAKQLIEKVGLGLAPGRAFGPEGEGWLRWCYAANWKKNQSGVERLTRFLSS